MKFCVFMLKSVEHDSIGVGHHFNDTLICQEVFKAATFGIQLVNAGTDASLEDIRAI